uniref:Uncharacterized protein n=1 Tax=Arundo donax TaxID=35708 RepID=A0A0A9AZM3_ARUDO
MKWHKRYAIAHLFWLSCRAVVGRRTELCSPSTSQINAHGV